MLFRSQDLAAAATSELVAAQHTFQQNPDFLRLFRRQWGRRSVKVRLARHGEIYGITYSSCIVLTPAERGAVPINTR